MLMIATVGFCALLLVLTGGSLTRLATIPFHSTWLVAAALGTQVLTISLLPQGNHGLHSVAHLGSYALIVAFLCANRPIPGVKLLTIGTVLNLAAITTNAGTMPASDAALRTAGIASQATHNFHNSTVLHHPRLAFLGDIFAVPARMPLHNVFSIGDVLIVVAACYTILTVGRSKITGVAPFAWTPDSGG